MKHTFLALGALLIFSACAGVRVADTQVASGATHPRAIYIRPFDVSDARFSGYHRGAGEDPIRQSLAPAEWSLALKEELEKLAPTTVLKDGEHAPTGWLVEGSLDVIDAGKPVLRFLAGPDNPLRIGRSKVKIHVRISDVGGRYIASDDKDAGLGRKHGNVVYEFDLAGGSRCTGGAGSTTAPGAGYATPFDFKNAAERVLIALSTDPFRYGERTSPGIR